MVTSTGASRASSVLSNARITLKRREKPYKTEQQKMIGKKRKLDVNVSIVDSVSVKWFASLTAPLDYLQRASTQGLHLFGSRHA